MDFSQNGAGLGLRPIHHAEFFENPQSVDWVEIISENYMTWRYHSPQKPLQRLEKIRSLVPVALHGVSLSIGSTDELDREYLQALKNLADLIEPHVISDHLCWTGVQGQNLHDLLPLPATPEVISWIAERISRVQDFLGKQILIENVSSYLQFKEDLLPEWEFLSEVVKRAGCGILLDVNNVFVNSVNHQFSAEKYLRSLPADRVGQIHLAGHSRNEDLLIDTHAEPVCAEVWELYRLSRVLFGPVNAMIEWDAQIPDWDVLVSDVKKIKEIQRRPSSSPFEMREGAAL